MGKTTYGQVGPWGGPGPQGSAAYEWRQSGRISKITVKTGGCIISISFAYICSCDGKEKQSPTYGGDCGQPEYMVLDKGEEIIEMSGTIGSQDGEKVVTSLTFRTNRKTCKFGTVTRDKFSLPINASNTKFVGFHGQYNDYVNSIGAFLEPK